jgi:ribosomal peptide maturation radical SAM protein 1
MVTPMPTPSGGRRRTRAKGKDGGVLLLSMPWQLLHQPSIQLGVLKSALARAKIPVATRLLSIDFMEHCLRSAGEGRIGLEDFDRISTRRSEIGLGDWIFAGPPFSDADPGDDDYVGFLRARGIPEPEIAQARALRSGVPAFLDACADRVLSMHPRIVGLTCTWNQTVPSLALARVLKARDSRLAIVLGGPNCDGVMGAAMHRAFPWVDAVVRGEAERVLPALVRDLLDGGPIRPQPGLCYRQGSVSICDPRTPEPVPMDEVPAPDYDDYFEQLKGASFRRDVVGAIELPLETSRGCWWGARTRCIFCGIDPGRVHYRSHAADRVAADIQRLVARHRALRIVTTDHVFDPVYLRTLLPALRDMGHDLSIFFEVRANVTRDDVRLMREAGIDAVQPGLESLSTPILKLMRKGTTALQNVRFLKWCARYGILAFWNLIWGLPGEPPAEYEKMADQVASLTHLQPPNPVRLSLTRSSPYHDHPDQFGIEVLGPPAWFGMVFPVDTATRADLASALEYRFRDGHDPASYTASLTRAIDTWQGSMPAGFRSLRYRRGPGFLVICDRRPNLERADYRFGEHEAAVYLACEDGATPAGVVRALGASARTLDPGDVKTFLDKLTRMRLVYREGHRYLALALPQDLPEMSPPQPMDPLDRANT